MKDVPGKVCLKQIVRYVKRADRREKKLKEFLVYFYGGDERAATKELAKIKREGLGTLQFVILYEEFHEWWEKEKKRRWGRNWQKAIESKKLKAGKREEQALSRYMEERKKANKELGFR
ncbi:unnamed protein product [uncultured bacterium]|nr:unnamed protein product [uncultured bacterium]